MRVDVLQIPMYGLYNIKERNEDILLNETLILKLKEDYSKEEISQIFEGLKWAVKNPDYDFSSLLPNLPVNNNRIFNYLVRWYEFLKKNRDKLGFTA